MQDYARPEMRQIILSIIFQILVSKILLIMIFVYIWLSINICIHYLVGRKIIILYVISFLIRQIDEFFNDKLIVL